MTYYLLIALCVIILISYVFDITSKYTKIPGVLLLIISGIAINYLLSFFGIAFPDLSGLLPIMGTIGLILIVLEASLDLNISSDKKRLISSSVSSAVILFILFVSVFTYILVNFYNFPIRQSLINTIPLGIISSAVAIPSASGLKKSDKEFVTYESSISDIIGIIAFDFLLYKNLRLGEGIINFSFEIILAFIVSVFISAGLAYILHKISHHVKYVIIMTVIILIYSLAKLQHMPSLIVVLIFGLIMNNNNLFNNKYTQKIINFEEFNNELKSFTHITGELTFIIRSFFFIMFGFYTDIESLLNINSLIIAIILSASIFIIRGLYFKIVLKMTLKPLLFYAPRGLITIVLFLTIPANQLLPFMNKGLVTQVIFITILLMAFGNILFNEKKERYLTTRI